MNKLLKILCVLSVIISSCTPTGVKDEEMAQPEVIKNKLSKQEREKELAALSLKPGNKIGEKKLEKGVHLTYFIHGEGEKIKEGDMVQINYEVLLKDGKVVDGNQQLRVRKDWLPFLVGFGMQTPGWDVAFQELRVGDFVEIYLPAAMARGEHGIKGIIPPNADNFIRVKVIGILPPTRVVDGTKVWVVEENSNETKKATTEDQVEFHYIVGSKSNPHYDISYRRNQPYVLKFSDFGIVKGLKKALINAKKSDKMYVVVPPSEAYGSKGLNNLVKPNEELFYDIFVMDVR